MEYCKNCLMPDTRPHNRPFNEQGWCDACQNYARRGEIDWEVRREEFFNTINRYISHDRSNWDCIVPVSGGKDSTYQVKVMIDLGMNPLCVTASTCHLSDIGRLNIENLKSLGVDYIEFSPNPIARRKLNRIGLMQVGDISWPEHAAIFTVPVRVAVRFNIPLLVWGECGQDEYGGPATEASKNVLDSNYLQEHGGLLGLRVYDMLGMEDLAEEDLNYYQYPSDEEINRVGVTGLYLGYYFPWDGLRNAIISETQGFSTFPGIVEGSMVNYENLDNYQTGIHDYFKYLKYGFGRATDIASLHVRRGRITRNQGIEIVNKHDGRFPWTYLGKPLDEILAPLEIDVDEFIRICDRFTNKKIFKTDASGKFVKDKDGTALKIKYPEPTEELTIKKSRK